MLNLDSIDELLDVLQQMIDMVRDHAPDLEDQCSKWQTHLYDWHDRWLEKSVEFQQNPGDVTTSIFHEITSLVLEVNSLRIDITQVGNGIFQ